jgi:hypothetical protein
VLRAVAGAVGYCRGVLPCSLWCCDWIAGSYLVDLRLLPAAAGTLPAKGVHPSHDGGGAVRVSVGSGALALWHPEVSSGEHFMRAASGLASLVLH